MNKTLLLFEQHFYAKNKNKLNTSRIINVLFNRKLTDPKLVPEHNRNDMDGAKRALTVTATLNIYITVSHKTQQSRDNKEAMQITINVTAYVYSR